MIAQPGQEAAADIRVDALFDILHPGPGLTDGHIEFTFTGDRTGMATDTAPDIDDHAILFSPAVIRAVVYICQGHLAPQRGNDARNGQHQARNDSAEKTPAGRGLFIPIMARSLLYGHGLTWPGFSGATAVLIQLLLIRFSLWTMVFSHDPGHS